MANGYYDLATPYYATEYTFATMQLAPSLADNVTMGYFEAGRFRRLWRWSVGCPSETLDA